MRDSKAGLYVRCLIAVMVSLAVVACDSAKPVAKPVAKSPSFRRPSGLIMALAFSPDGQVITSGGSASVASLRRSGDTWLDGDVFTTQNDVPGQRDYTLSLAYSSDGKFLAAGQNSGFAQVWSMDKPQEPPIRFDKVCSKVSSVTVNAVAFKPDSHTLVMGCDNELIVSVDIDQPATDPTILYKVPGSSVSEVLFSPDGRIMAVPLRDNVISLWDTGDLQRKPTILTVPGGHPSSLAFSPDGHWLASSGYDGAIWVWNMDHLDRGPSVVANGTPGPDISSDINSICFTSDSKLIAAAYQKAQVRIWDASQPNTPIGEYTDYTEDVSNVACSTKEHLVASANDDIVRLIDLDAK